MGSLGSLLEDSAEKLWKREHSIAPNLVVHKSPNRRRAVVDSHGTTTKATITALSWEAVFDMLPTQSLNICRFRLRNRAARLKKQIMQKLHQGHSERTLHRLSCPTPAHGMHVSLQLRHQQNWIITNGAVFRFPIITHGALGSETYIETFPSVTISILGR